MTPRFGKDSYTLRIFLLVILIFCSVTLITIRLFALQVLSHSYYKELAGNQHLLNKELIPARGEIFIRDHFSQTPYPVVTNVNRPTIYAVPQQIQDAPTIAKRLAGILKMDTAEILNKLSDVSKKYVSVAKNVEEPLAEKIEEQKLPGVYLEDQILQKYPEGAFASQVLGFVAYDADHRVGRYGLENYFEHELAGTPGVLAGARDPRGIWISDDRQLTPAQDGDDFVLTIDRAIQFKVEEVLKKTVDFFKAKNGSVVVLNPKTGAVLAMANYPSFDPNEFNKVEDPVLYNNIAIQTGYEPGSVMKPFTMAASLQEGKITPDTTFEDPGSVTLENFTIRNSENKKYGQVTMTQVLEESINTGAIYAEQQIDHQKFKEYLENFGFGKATGVSLPYEAKGNIDNIYKGGDLYPATMSFGQGMTVTPMQLAIAYGAIANGGKLMRPYIVEEKISSSGQVAKTEPQEVRQLISQQTASTLAAMLVSVVERGHGKRAGVPGYFIAGKTGTAQVAYTDRAGYDPNRNIGTFAGFGPIDNPAFVMVVKIEEPLDVKFAESTAAPAFGEIARFILDYYQVPKSR